MSEKSPRKRWDPEGCAEQGRWRGGGRLSQVGSREGHREGREYGGDSPGHVSVSLGRSGRGWKANSCSVPVRWASAMCHTQRHLPCKLLLTPSNSPLGKAGQLLAPSSRSTAWHGEPPRGSANCSRSKDKGVESVYTRAFWF